MRFRSLLGALVCGAAITVTAAGAAVAAPPVVIGPFPDDVVAELPPEMSCGDFGVTVSAIQGKTLAILFESGRAFYAAPGSKYRVATEGGSFVDIQGNGAFHDQAAVFLDPPLEYGGVTYELAIPSKLTGHNLLAGPIISDTGDVTPQVLAVRGRATLTMLLDFDSGYFAFADLRGSTTDLCAALSG